MKGLLIKILAVVGALSIIAFGLIFYFILKVDYKYTGEQLFEAVNEHRKEVGVAALELDPILCDNLVERWIAIKEPNSGHKGYEEWVKGEGILDNSKFGQIGEIYVSGISTPENAIAFWLSSPGHKSTLEMKEMVYGCAYAGEGAGVVVMATKGVNMKSY